MTSRQSLYRLSTGRQRGAGKLVLILLLVVLLFFINLAVRLVPPYVDHLYARSIAESVMENAGGSIERSEFLSDFQRRARVNNVDLDDSVFSFEGNPATQVILSYERRVPVLFNVDAVISFEERFPE